MYRFFKGIPLAFLEAARLDGAGELKLFFIVAIPLGSPGVISAIVLGFLEYWNLIEQPMAFLKTKSLWPLSLYLSTDRYLPDRKGICGICSGSDPGSDRFSGRAGLSGTRDHIHGNQGIERQKREDLSMKKIKTDKNSGRIFCPDAFVYFSVQGGRFGECSTGRDKNSSESGDHA